MPSEMRAGAAAPLFPPVGYAKLRNAIERWEIYPVFQPIVALATGLITGFEVLARWHDEEMGPVPAKHFVEIAEQSGLIAPLMAQLIEAACSSAISWGPGLRLAFNLSPLQFRDPDLPEQLDTIVRQTGFPFTQIQFEVTESALIDDLDAARGLIARLKCLGAEVALDDFGTGFSSLVWLQALPFDRIKIDARFVRSMAFSGGSRKIVGAVTNLGQSLGMSVVAEGIETMAEAWMLGKIGCDYGQGFLFGRPLLAEAVPAMLEAFARRPHVVAPPDICCPLPKGLLDAIYHAAPIAQCFVDVSCHLLSANRKFAEWAGVEERKIVGRRIGDIRPEILPQVVNILDAAIHGSALHTSESLIIGGNRSLLSVVSAVRDEANDVAGISIALIDVTKHRASLKAHPFGRRARERTTKLAVPHGAT